MGVRWGGAGVDHENHDVIVGAALVTHGGAPPSREVLCLVWRPVQLGLRFGGVSPDGTSVRDEPSQQHEHLETRGDVLTAISDGMVALLKEFYGRGPTRAKSYYEDDLVVCATRRLLASGADPARWWARPRCHSAAHGVSGGNA